MIVAAEVLRGHSRGPKKTSIVQMAATSMAFSAGFPPKNQRKEGPGGCRENTPDL